MRIGIDFHVLHGNWPGAGIRRYIEGLYRAVLSLPSRHEWVFFVEDPSRVPKDWPGRPEWQGFGSTSKIARLTWGIRRRLREECIDSYHVQFVSPLWSGCKDVATIHDLLFESHPQYFPRSTQYTLAPLVRRTAARASLIFTISEYSRSQLIERYKVDPERICLTSVGIDRAMFNPGDPQASRDLVLETYQLEDYILSVGRLEPRKNHRALVESYAYLKTKGKSLPRLVLVGGKDFGYEPLATLIREKGLEKEVVFLHSISDQMLPHLYRAAMMMTYPSFAEGFGIPPLEAMACGCPVISSGTTALKEVIGDAGRQVDPKQWPMIAEAMFDLLQDHGQRQGLREKGLQQAAKFSWENSANALIAAYDRLG